MVGEESVVAGQIGLQPYWRR
ncbi:hypothetical protein CCACVL1_10398 [Corchorus capsularis]|uniref:Uncharacterized protein n=1 Tax=Corchorus capsularis TaxID=210143 RepID=A0A1R3IR94_COCAP|nr:hypothetical protein CCACVL1_10398 [Corchorus capsularis]